HPILDHSNITLANLCEYPMVTYVLGFTGRKSFNDTFSKAGLTPHIVLSAADTNIIKTYVQEEMGIGVIASMAIEEVREADIECRDISHLFPWEVTRIAYLKDKFLRQYEQKFIDLFLDHVRDSEDRKIQPL
ncbi:MAG: LysR family cys regulon transcriptional activator, partial [Gammaproteobacteria bacterium]